jgi:hypothetical protein
MQQQAPEQLSILCARLKNRGQDMISAAHELYIMHGDKHLFNYRMQRLRNLRDEIDGFLREYERETSAPTPADEHQQDIANGAVSFKAFRDARGGL